MRTNVVEPWIGGIDRHQALEAFRSCGGPRFNGDVLALAELPLGKHSKVESDFYGQSWTDRIAGVLYRFAGQVICSAVALEVRSWPLSGIVGVLMHKSAVLNCPKCLATGVALWAIDKTGGHHEVLRLPQGFASADGVGPNNTHYFVCTSCWRIAESMSLAVP